jgi:polyphosphate kinase
MATENEAEEGERRAYLRASEDTLEHVSLRRALEGIGSRADHASGPGGPDLGAPEYYINRELSWLEFNRRVLMLALDDSMPLLERLKFLGISCTNLDEFFEIRVGRLKQQLHMDAVRVGPDGLTPFDQLIRIGAVTHEFVAEQYRILNDVLIPALAEQHIRFVRRTTWNAAQARWVASYFERELSPVLSPLGLDPSHPFPRVLNKSLNFIVTLDGQDAFGRTSGIAVVQAPRSLPRLIQLPPEVAQGPHDFIFLSSVIHAHVHELFPGMRVKGCYQFRVTRNSELFVDEEEVEDLMHALEDELYTRHYGNAVRLEVADTCPQEVTQYLLDEFDLTEADLYRVEGPVNLNRIMEISSLVDRVDLKFPSFTPHVPLSDRRKPDLFAMIRERDVLLHHPFESFSVVMDLIRQAASDPDVLAIKQTLYRTEVDSQLTDALVEAAHRGKEVTAVIELRARFDEQRNIQIAGRLQEAGAHVVYGVVGYKTHAKMLLIVRREAEGLVRYTHLGTGNYHPRTTRLYTDFGLLTCDPTIGQDVHKMFQQLTGLCKMMKLERLYQSPFTLHAFILDRIEREIANARAGKPARIMAKMNSLTETEVIQSLYRASQAGVRVDLIVRGICRLRPGIPGVSENIHVRSIVGRFLEHARVFYFESGGTPEVYCASADWMTRNLIRRVETCFPILDPELARRVIHESFELYLQDNTQAWILGPDGTYTHTIPISSDRLVNAQATLLQQLSDPPEPPERSGGWT